MGWYLFNFIRRYDKTRLKFLLVLLSGISRERCHAIRMMIRTKWRGFVSQVMRHIYMNPLMHFVCTC